MELQFHSLRAVMVMVMVAVTTVEGYWFGHREEDLAMQDMECDKLYVSEQYDGWEEDDKRYQSCIDDLELNVLRYATASAKAAHMDLKDWLRQNAVVKDRRYRLSVRGGRKNSLRFVYLPDTIRPPDRGSERDPNTNRGGIDITDPNRKPMEGDGTDAGYLAMKRRILGLDHEKEEEEDLKNLPGKNEEEKGKEDEDDFDLSGSRALRPSRRSSSTSSERIRPGGLNRQPGRRFDDAPESVDDGANISSERDKKTGDIDESEIPEERPRQPPKPILKRSNTRNRKPGRRVRFMDQEPSKPSDNVGKEECEDLVAELEGNAQRANSWNEDQKRRYYTCTEATSNVALAFAEALALKENKSLHEWLEENATYDDDLGVYKLGVNRIVILPRHIQPRRR